MKTATELRKALEDAREKELSPVKLAVRMAITQVEEKMEAALADPGQFSKNPYFGGAMPVGAFYEGSYKEFIRLLSEFFVPLGHVVKESHGGGGMYATYFVHMPDIAAPRARIQNM